MSRIETSVLKGNGTTLQSLVLGSNGQIGLKGANYGTSGQILTSIGTGSLLEDDVPVWFTAPLPTPAIAVGGSGTYSINTGKTIFVVYCIGAGGGSSGSSTSTAGWGGGGGGCAWRVYNSTEMGSTFTITVGSGGAAGASGYAGSNGGSTTFDPSGTGVTLTGGGGSGGNYAGGAGGTATNGIQNWTGQAGDHPTLINSTHYLGRGGASLFHSYLGSNGGKGADANTGGSNISGNAGHNGCVVIFQY